MSEVEIYLRAVDEASSVIEQAGSNMSATFGDIEGKTQSLVSATDTATSQMATDYNQVGDATANLEDEQVKSQASFGDSAMAMNSLALSGATLFMSVERVENAQVMVDRANLNVQRSTAALEKAQDAYNLTLQKYGVDSPQAQDAADKLTIATEAHRVSVERADMASRSMSTTMLTSALTVIPSLISIVGAVSSADEIWTGIQWALNAAMDANPISIIIIAIAGLVALIIVAYTQCEPFRNIINAIGNALYSVFKPAIDAISAALTWLWNNAISPVISVIRYLWDLITNNPILAALFGPITMIAYLIGHWNDVVAAISAALQWLGNVLAPLGNAISAVGNAVSGAWGFISGIIGTGCGLVSAAYDELNGKATTTADAVKTSADKLKDAMQSVDDALAKQTADLEAKYAEQTAAVDANLSKQVETITAKYAEMVKAENDKYTEDYNNFITYYNNKYTETQTDLDKLLTKVNSHYDDEISKTEGSYGTLINDANKFYDDLDKAADENLRKISEARQADLDNLELNMLLEKEQLKAAHDAGTLSEADYQKAVSDLQKNYNTERGNMNDTYRVQELEAEKKAKDDHTTIAAQRKEAVVSIEDKEKTDVTKIQNDKFAAVTEITNKDKELRTNHENELAKLTTDKENEIKDATEAAAAAKVVIVRDKEDEINAAVQKAEDEKAKILQGGGEQDKSVTTDTWGGIAGTITSIAGSIGSALGDWGSSVFGSISSTFSSITSTVGSAMSSVASAVSSGLSGAASAISGFIGTICFAHALEAAAVQSQKTMTSWMGMIQGSMGQGLGMIKSFGAELEKIGILPSVGGGGAGAPVSVAAAKAPVVVHVSAPLVYIEGSADKATVDLASKHVLEQLKNVIIEPTSVSAPATSKRIRLGVVMT